MYCCWRAGIGFHHTLATCQRQSFRKVRSVVFGKGGESTKCPRLYQTRFIVPLTPFYLYYPVMSPFAASSRASTAELPAIGRFMLHLSSALLVTSPPVLFPVSPFLCAHLLLDKSRSLMAFKSSTRLLVTVRVPTSHR